MTEVLAGDAIRLDHLDEAGRSALFTSARTASSFAPVPVTDDELSGIWELAKWPPTGGNSQPLRVLYVRTPEGKDRLIKHMAEGNQAKVASAPAVAVLAVDTRFYEHLPTVFPIRPQMKDAFAADPVMSAKTSEFSATLQAGYFILAVRANGLAAGPMAGFDAAGIDAEFFPGGRWRTMLVVNIGHPGDKPWHDRLPRLSHEEVIRWA